MKEEAQRCRGVMQTTESMEISVQPVRTDPVIILSLLDVVSEVRLMIMDKQAVERREHGIVVDSMQERPVCSVV